VRRIVPYLLHLVDALIALCGRRVEAPAGILPGFLLLKIDDNRILSVGIINSVGSIIAVDRILASVSIENIVTAAAGQVVVIRRAFHVRAAADAENMVGDRTGGLVEKRKLAQSVSDHTIRRAKAP